MIASRPTRLSKPDAIHVDAKPADLGQSGWQAILPQRTPEASLQQDIDSDYLIVGAGFAGLMAARRLRQLNPDARITILDATEVAAGPAGRNSGFMIDLPHALASGSYEGDRAEDLRKIAMNRAAIDYAEECAQTYGFESGAFARSGKVNAAGGAVGMRHNDDYAQHLQALKEPFDMIDAAGMRDLCGSDYYLGGLRTPGTALIQPAQFVRLLAGALQTRESCRLFEHSPVTALMREGDRWRVQTDTGSVTAGRVILAVNGLIESFGFYRHRLMHINLYGSMTRALSEAESAALGGQREWGFTPSDPIGSTVRRIESRDGPRLVIRNGCTYDPKLHPPAARLPSIAAKHRSTFAARFPMLADVEMEYCWSGRLCLSRNDSWAIGELAPGLYSACCQNGLGTTRGTIAGIVAAEMASDDAGPSRIPQFRSEEEPSRLFPEPFMTLGARATIRLKEMRAGRDL